MRSVGSSKDKTWPLVRSAGIDLLYELGFEAMNTRALAQAVGLKPGSLYYYFESKEDFLYKLVEDLLQEIINDVETTLSDVTDCVERLDTFIACLVRWHVERYKETAIARIEIRSLSGDRLTSFLALRDQFDLTLNAILRDGIEEGRMSPPNPHMTRIAILAMVTGITGWYRPNDGLVADDVVEFYVGLVRRMAAVNERV